MRYFSACIMVSIAMVATPAWGVPRLATPHDVSFFSLLSDTDAYRMGDVWTKEPLRSDSLAAYDATVQNAALGVAMYGTSNMWGTAFYLGKFNGEHLMATNHHVQPDLHCGHGWRARFPFADVSYPCKWVYLSWPSVDWALFSIDVAPDDEAHFEGLGHNFAFDTPVTYGQQLFTLGFGHAGNPRSQLVIDHSRFCRVFDDDVRFIEDPDAMNRMDYKVWSVPVGCAISHGDSGSAFYDAATGRVMGLLWTGQTPKDRYIQSDKHMQRVFDKRSPRAWTMLSYGAPASAIGKAIERALEKTPMSTDTREILTALIGPSPSDR